MGAEVFRRTCVSAEFRALRSGRASPVTLWLRALARRAHDACGGPGVGVVGMCFTGNFALPTALEASVLAPVTAQPSLPLDDPAGIDASPAELAALRRRLDRDGLTVLAYRFEGDRFCRAERFAAYAEALGDRFVPRVLPGAAAGRRDLPPFFARHVPAPHSVLTVHLIDRHGQPTAAARDEVLAFLTRRLRPASDGRPGHSGEPSRRGGP